MSAALFPLKENFFGYGDINHIQDIDMAFHELRRPRRYNGGNKHQLYNSSRSHTISESSCGSPNSGNGPSKLCESWKAGKTCRFGNRCWYAHGPSELKPYIEHHDYVVPETRAEQPTRAQLHWMMMSQQSEQSQVAHEAILNGNRFNRDLPKHSRAEHRHHSNASKKDHNNNHNRKEMDLGTLMNHHKTNNLTPLVELLKDVEEAPLRTYSPGKSDFPFSWPSKEMLNEACLADISNLVNRLASVDLIKNYNQENNTHEVCDIYAISGFCPLGDGCCFEHKPRLL